MSLVFICVSDHVSGPLPISKLRQGAFTPYLMAVGWFIGVSNSHTNCNTFAQETILPPIQPPTHQTTHLTGQVQRS